MNHRQQPDDTKQQTLYERERQELLEECRSLLALIGQRPYAIKLLKSTRQGLLMHLSYKANR